MNQLVIWEELGHPPEKQRNSRFGKPNGYPAMPGTGPEGETCKTCKFKTYKTMANRYIKCELMRRHWTGGAGTDIKAGSPACRNWKKLEVANEKIANDS